MAAAGGPLAEGLGAAAADGAVAVNEVFRDLSEIPFLRIVLIGGAAWLLAKLLAWALPKAAEALPGRLRVRVLPWVPVLRLAILMLALVLIVPLVISFTPQNLFAILGALGIALGFAFKDLVSSVVAGVVAVFERPYRQGDWVRLGRAYGEVHEVGLRAVTLRTPTGDTVTVPHARLWTDNVRNANDGERTLMVVTALFLQPDHDGARMDQRLREIAWTSPWLDPTRPVRVHIAELAWGTRYLLMAYPLDARDQFDFRSDLTVRAKDVVRAIGARYAPAVPAAPLDPQVASPVAWDPHYGTGGVDGG